MEKNTGAECKRDIKDDREPQENEKINLKCNIVRVEYPGLVKNTEKALETLGGLNMLELVVSGVKANLELNFHPDNYYNKSCIAEKDSSSGILIKVTTSKDESTSEPKVDYEVIGATCTNFKFNRLCDFQRLPVIENPTSSEDEYIHDAVFPEKIPDLKWFMSKEVNNQKKFFCPTVFSRVDSAVNKLHVNLTDKNYITSTKLLGSSNTAENEKTKSLKNMKSSQFVSLLNPNFEVPTQPNSNTLDIIQERNLQGDLEKVKKLFEERPIWLKAGIQYRLGLTHEHAKHILPAVGYFCTVGPWRNCWIKFGCNPMKDYNSRIYQTLDYRIRSDGIKIKVEAKRNYHWKNKKGRGLKESTSIVPSNVPEERAFILKPPYKPPARQMFYQFCDIYLPAIQEMLQRLPKIPTHVKFDPKNGWFPSNFLEQCREIVNKYVFEQVQKELREDKSLQNEESEEMESDEAEALKKVTYCSEMLDNIKKGIYKTTNIFPGGLGTSKSQIEQLSESLDTVDLLEDTRDGKNEEIDATDVIKSIPERMEVGSDDELSQGSDLDIDMEAVEEINQFIAQSKKDVGGS